MSDTNGKELLAGHLTSFMTFRLARAHNKLNAQISHYLRIYSDIGLVDWRVLRLLEAMGDTTMSQLSQLSRKIRGLVERKLVTSRVDQVDSRQQILRIDEAGRQLVRDILPKVQERQRLLVEGISQADLEVFLEVLAKIDAASETRDPL